MTKTTYWMFSGQGSQYFQMARELRESDAAFRGALEQADEIVKPLLNESLVHEIYRTRADRFEPFRRITHSHPAILIIEHALAQSLLARGLRPDRIIGHSLGELSAFVLAGSLSFEAALTAVVKQALVLEYCAPKGAMIVVLENVDLMARAPELFEGCEMAGTHFKRSFVVAGSVAAVQRARRLLKERQVDTHELPVAHPFHSSAMDVVKTPIMATLAPVTFAPTRIPVFSVGSGTIVEVPTAAHLWHATRSATDFPATVRRLESTGPNFYVDLGPSGSMATTVKYNLEPGSASEFFPIITPFGHELKNIERVLAKVRAA